jgi:hypothetical protein
LNKLKSTPPTLLQPKPNAHVASEIDVFAVAEDFWWGFDTVEIEVRRERDEEVLLRLTQFYLEALLEIEFRAQEGVHANAVSVWVVTNLLFDACTY